MALYYLLQNPGPLDAVAVEEARAAAWARLSLARWLFGREGFR